LEVYRNRHRRKKPLMSDTSYERVSAVIVSLMVVIGFVVVGVGLVLNAAQ